MTSPSTLMQERLPPTGFSPGDPLSETLHLLRLTGTLYCRSELSAPWGIDIPPLGDAMSFLFLMSGSAWLELDGYPPEHLRPGSLTLLPHGVAHSLRSEPEASALPLLDLPVEKISDRYEILHHGGGGEITHALYGVMRVDHVAARQLIAQLPGIVHVDALADDPDGWLRTTMHFISREARAMKPGGETVITRLADILVIQALRSWIATAPAASPGWLTALRDRSIGRALTAFHRAPQETWTVARLAEIAGMSRSTFSDRITGMLGQPVMGYLTHWRMQLARQRLRETDDPLAAIAADVGYRSESAFCRTYRRVFGEAPGKARRNAEQSSP